jgi:hypothetical protein
MSLSWGELAGLSRAERTPGEVAVSGRAGGWEQSQPYPHTNSKNLEAGEASYLSRGGDGHNRFHL